MTYVLFFSPTGTTAKIAIAVSEGIEMECKIFNATYSAIDDLYLTKDDLAIIAAPVYGGKMAPIARQRLSRIKGESTPCILLTVYGNRAFENALCDMSEFAESLGLIPVAAGAFVGEHSYSSEKYPIAEGRPDEDDLQTAVNFGRFVSDKMHSGTLLPIDTSTITDFPVSQESLHNFRKFIQQYQDNQKKNTVKLVPVTDSDLCIKCGECISLCPTNAIADDCQTVAASLCIKCCACVKGCKMHARHFDSPFAPVLSQNFSKRKEPVIMV